MARRTNAALFKNKLHWAITGKTAAQIIAERANPKLPNMGLNTRRSYIKEFPFSETNLNNAILAMRDLPVQDGFIPANKTFYELIILSRSFESQNFRSKKRFHVLQKFYFCPL